MSTLILLFGVCLAGAAPEVLVSDLSHETIRRSGSFVSAESPYAHHKDYVRAVAVPDGDAATLRVPAPAGEYYVYLAWVREPKSARDVLVRVAGREFRIDQRLLACGLDPAKVARDDMDGYAGVCNSGLYRLGTKPLRLSKGDLLEVVRSDTEAETITSLDYVLFSRHLYLDDLGNGATLRRPAINVRDYGRNQSGDIGYGVALLEQPGEKNAMADIEWAIPAAGRYLLEATPFCGPNRAAQACVKVEVPGVDEAEVLLPSRAGDFGRSGWKRLALLDGKPGTKITVRASADGIITVDLLRLRPLGEADLAALQTRGQREITIQWEAASEAKPWLKEVRAVPVGKTLLRVSPLRGKEPMPNGIRVRAAKRVPIIGSGGDTALLPEDGALRVMLADGYGFTLSTALLRREPFVWLKDLGIFASSRGTFAAMQEEIAELEAAVAKGRAAPFRSPSEQYWEWLGANVWDGGTDGRAFRFAYQVPRPSSPRVAERIRAMPEVGFEYFCRRIPDVRFHRMFLGWPNVAQEFTVLSNGTIEVRGGSSKGTGHPAAQDFAVAFGIGKNPQFRAHGDPQVTQSIEDGYHLAVHTSWRQDDTAVETVAVAYPLVGEEVRTGWEPLGVFVRFRRRRGSVPLWLRLSQLPELKDAAVKDGCLVAGKRLVLSVDGGDLAVESADEKATVVKLTPRDGYVDLVIPYVAVPPDLVARARRLGFDKALAAAKKYWDARLARGARVDVPDPAVAQQYKTIYPRIMITGDLDSEGDYALKTSPTHYEDVWLHCTSYGIEALCRRGHFEEARQYLDAGFRWQGSQRVQNAPGYTNWEGFFNAPPRYTALLWVNFHGWFQWVSARYYLFSDDRQWLDGKLPALIKSLEWTASQRKLTMRENEDGSRPANYGWLPAGRVTDGSVGTSTFSDCINWLGFNEVVTVLERIDHPRAAEFCTIADDYRACILRGLKMATATREPVRLADGTYVPYVPGYLESNGHEEDMWYAAVVDGGLLGILDSGILAPGEPLEDWVCHNLQDNLFVLAPNLADEGHFLGQGCSYVRRDEPEMAVYTLYSCLATQMARETRTTYEHRSWGAGRIYELTPWAGGYWNRMLCGMLCYDEGGRLVIGRGMPRAWLEPGKRIRIEQLQTRFGPVSFTLSAEENRIHGILELPTRYRPAGSSLRLRLRGRVESVKLNGQAAAFDGATESVALPVEGGRVEVEAVLVRSGVPQP